MVSVKDAWYSFGKAQAKRKVPHPPALDLFIVSQELCEGIVGKYIFCHSGLMGQGVSEYLNCYKTGGPIWDMVLQLGLLLVVLP